MLTTSYFTTTTDHNTTMLTKLCKLCVERCECNAVLKLPSTVRRTVTFQVFKVSPTTRVSHGSALRLPCALYEAPSRTLVSAR